MTTTDLRALGRLGQSQDRLRPSRRRRRLAMRPVRGVPAATPRRRVPRAVLATLALALSALGLLGMTAARQTAPDERLAAVPAAELDAGDGGDRAATGDAPGGQPAGGDLPAGATADGAAAGRHAHTADRASRSAGELEPTPAGEQPPTFAVAEDLHIGLPHAEPALVAFHEASLPEALALTPVGTLEHSANAAFDGGARADGPTYHVLASRGRPRAPTSAVDIVVPQGAGIVAPVSGTVVQARQYALYGSIRDWRVVIEASDRPDLHVVLIHLHRPAVAPGDEVVAGQTPLGVVRQLPITSQVDEVVGEALPHVHLEVKAATTPKPMDPNKPAVELEDALGTNGG